MQKTAKALFQWTRDQAAQRAGLLRWRMCEFPPNAASKPTAMMLILPVVTRSKCLGLEPKRFDLCS